MGWCVCHKSAKLLRKTWNFYDDEKIATLTIDFLPWNIPLNNFNLERKVWFLTMPHVIIFLHSMMRSLNLQNFFKNKINFLIKGNKSKTTIIEMLVESQNKSSNDQKSTETFEVVKHRKCCKPGSISNEPINCKNRYQTLLTDRNDV